MKEFLRGAFSDGGAPSSSRLLTALHSVVACGLMVGVFAHTHGLPSAGDMMALGGFATIHYAVNRGTTAWGKNGSAPGSAPPAS